MMNCDDVRTEMSALLDGELSLEVRQAVRRHVEACTGCRDEAAGLDAVRQGVAALATPPLPPGLQAGVLRELARRRHSGWRDRFRAGVDRALDLLLGSPSGALQPAQVWRGALAGSCAMAAMSVLSAYVLAATMVRWIFGGFGAILTLQNNLVLQRFSGVLPVGNWDPNRLLLLMALPLLVSLVLGARLLGAGALLGDLRRGARLDPWAVVRFFVGLLGVLLVVGGAMLAVAGSVSMEARGLAAAVYFRAALHLASWLLAGGALAVLVMRAVRGVSAMAVAFYGALLAAWASHVLFGRVWDATSAIRLTSDDVAVFVVSLSPESLWRSAALAAAGTGILTGIVSTCLAYRHRVMVREVVVPGALLALGLAVGLGAHGWSLDRDVRDRLQAGQGIVRAAALETGTGSTRTALVLAASKPEPSSERDVPASPEAEVKAFPIHAALADDAANAKRLASFLEAHPHSLASGEAHRVRIAQAYLRWDEPAFLEAARDYAVSPSSPPCYVTQFLWKLTRAVPSARYLPYLQAMADPRQFAIPEKQGRFALAAALERHGDAATARGLRAAAGGSAAETDRSKGKPTDVRDGRVSGILVLDGKPLALAAVRLFCSREQNYYSSEAVTDLDAMLNWVGGLMKDEEAVARLPWRPDTHWTCRPFTAARTDAAGAFRFDHLVDARYVLAVLLDRDLTGRSVRGLNVPKGIDLSAQQRAVDLGEIRLTIGGK